MATDKVIYLSRGDGTGYSELVFTPAANGMLGFNATSDPFSVPTATFGRSLLNLADAAAGQAALDLVPGTHVASLVSGKIPTAQLPALAITDTFVVANQTEMLALTAEVGDIAIRTDLNKSFILKTAGANVLANWQELLTPSDSVSSVNGMTGAVTLTTSNVAEGTNLYFTNARARSTLSASGPLSYNASTGGFSIAAASNFSDGYLTAANWTTFNAKQNQSAQLDNLSANSGAVDLSGTTLTLPTLASLTVTGTVTAGSFSGSGSALTALNASNLSSGVVAAARGGAGTVNGLLKANGSGTVSAAVAGTDFFSPASPPSFTVITGKPTTLGGYGITDSASFTTYPPLYSNSPGSVRQWSFDANYYYLCVATNSWRRWAINTW